MVGNLILYALYYIVFIILYPMRWLPDAELPQLVSNAMSNISFYIGFLGDFVVLDYLKIFISSIMTVELSIASYKLIAWVYKKIPGIN